MIKFISERSIITGRYLMSSKKYQVNIFLLWLILDDDIIKKTREEYYIFTMVGSNRYWVVY